jgi:hypothetical protein
MSEARSDSTPLLLKRKKQRKSAEKVLKNCYLVLQTLFHSPRFNSTALGHPVGCPNIPVLEGSMVLES